MRPLTCSCFLLLPLETLSLLAVHHLPETCVSSLWSSLFPHHALALTTFSLAKVRLLLTLTLSHHTILGFGQTALFPLHLAKTALAYLPTVFSFALRPLFLFQQAQYVQVFPLKLAPLCKLFAGLGSINKFSTSLPLLSDSRSVLATLSSPPSFLLPQYLWKIRQEPSSFFLSHVYNSLDDVIMSSCAIATVFC